MSGNLTAMVLNTVLEKGLKADILHCIALDECFSTNFNERLTDGELR